MTSELGEVKAQLQGLRELTDFRLSAVDRRLDTLSKGVGTLTEKHEGRLVKVERVVWVLTGLFVLFGVPLMLYVMTRVLGGMLP